MHKVVVTSEAINPNATNANTMYSRNPTYYPASILLSYFLSLPFSKKHIKLDVT